MAIPRRSAKMKALTATLFILGVPWALLVAGVVISPIGIFMPEYKFQMHDIVFSLVASACGLVGFFVWLGYRSRWKTGTFSWLTKRQFWTVSLLHHLGWVLLLPLGFSLGLEESYWIRFSNFWLADGPHIFRIWVITSLIVSVLALLFDSEQMNEKTKPAEQGSAHQSTTAP